MASFLNFKKLRFSVSKPIKSVRQWNLLAVVFMPILDLLFLYVLNLSCLPVQIVWSIKVKCSKVEGKSSWFIGKIMEKYRHIFEKWRRSNGFFLEMSTFFWKMMTSNEACDSILDVYDIQTSSNIYDDDDDGQSWSIIMPYLGMLYLRHSPNIDLK